MAKVGTYYGAIPYICEELLDAEIITIHRKDGSFYVYKVSGKVPKLIYYSSKMKFYQSK